MAESSVGGAVIGSLKVLIGADVAGLLEGVNKSREALHEFREEEEVTSSGLKTLGVAIGAAALAFGVEFVHSAMEAVDAQYLLSQQLGVSVRSLQIMQQASKESGGSAEEFNKAAQRMNATLGEIAIKGAGPAYDALKRLGLSATDLAGMDLDKRFKAIAERMDELGYSTQQEAAFLKDLGIRGGALLGVFQNAGDVIDEATGKVDGFGVALSNADASRIHEAQDAIEQVGITLTGIANQIAAELAPYIVYIGDEFKDAATEAHGFGQQTKAAVDGVALSVGYVLDGVRLLEAGVDSLDVLMHAIALGLDNLFLGTMQDIAMVVDGIANLGKIAGTVVPGLADMADKVQEQMAKAVQYQKDGVAQETAAMTASVQKVKDLFSQPWPSDSVKKAIDEINDPLAKVGDAAADARRKLDAMFGGAADTGGSDADKAAKKAAQEKLDSELKSLQSSLQATEFSENQSYEQRTKDLQTFLQKKMITQAQFDDLAKREEQDHTNKLQTIREKAFQDETKLQFATINMITGALDSITSAIQSSGEDQFGIAKAFSVATALLKGYESITSSYAAGAAIGGPVLGAVFAGLAAASTAAQLMALRGVTSSSTGTPSVAGGGGSATAAAATAPAGPSAGQTMTINGLSRNSLFSGDAVRDLVKVLVQYQRDGGSILLGKN